MGILGTHGQIECHSVVASVRVPTGTEKGKGVKEMLSTCLTVHPYAELFPKMSDEELKKLADDISENRQTDPIVVDQNDKVIDGRSRLAACEMYGIEPIFDHRAFKDDKEVLAFIISRNLVRRHLSDHQRALVAADIANLRHGGDRKSVEKNQAANGPLDPNDQPVESLVSQEEAADLMNVSERNVRRARRINTKGTAKLKKAVKEEKVSIRRAEEISTLPEEEQDKAVDEVVSNETKPRRSRRSTRPDKDVVLEDGRDMLRRMAKFIREDDNDEDDGEAAQPIVR